jgi:YbbR domain-containing protein
VVGPRRELIKLTGAHLTLTRILPDTITGRAVTLDLLPSEVEVPRGGEVRVQDIQPRQVTLQLDPVVFRSVPVHPDLRLELDSGTRLMRAVQVFPGVVRLTGPADQVARIDSVKTIPLRVEKVEGLFERSVAVDTEGFGTVRVSPSEVMISFEVLPDTGKREGQ